MLDQRDYMRREPGYSSGCIFSIGAVMTLLIANVFFFIFSTTPVIDKMSLKIISFRESPVEVSYRLVSYMFLHGSFAHILFNMWGLYLFGSLLENRIGAHRFYALYFISGISGGLLWLVANWNFPYMIVQNLGATFKVPTSCVGASGAIFGIIAATAMFYPDMPIMLLFPPIPMKMRTFAIAYAVAEVIFEISGTGGNVAHLAHLGGFIGGYIYVKITFGNQVWGISSLFKRRAKRPLYNKNENIFFSGYKTVSQEELDRLLDKISTEGINSLTEEEMDTLRRAREEMNKRM
ncbi:MAG TPA: rhomboid family intramembrane serine protease [Victivallales bacterium]|nr:rhomboid family intramembrane serine protease [Victivallales bacterium]HPO90158.1 rhomboid family intramembrane serine protease [Victivallales bacterium]